MAFVVIYDANVLYPNPLRDLLIRVALAGLVQAKWTDQILDECFNAIKRTKPHLDEAKLDRTRQLMNNAVRDCLVEGYEPLIEALSLPDPDDRHILAAAIRCGAQVIVTFNLKDFPQSALEPFGIEAKHPDEFMLDLIDLAPGQVYAAVESQAAAMKNPPTSVEELMDTFVRQRLIQSTLKLKELFNIQ